MNVSGSNLDIIGTETVADDGSNLTVTVNGSRNRKTTGITARATERNGHGTATRSGLGYKRAGQELAFLLSYFLLTVFFVFLSEKVVSCFI